MVPSLELSVSNRVLRACPGVCSACWVVFRIQLVRTKKLQLGRFPQEQSMVDDTKQQQSITTTLHAPMLQPRTNCNPRVHTWARKVREVCLLQFPVSAPPRALCVACACMRVSATPKTIPIMVQVIGSNEQHINHASRGPTLAPLVLKESHPDPASSTTMYTCVLGGGGDET